jgi:hypothetical protein
VIVRKLPVLNRIQVSKNAKSPSICPLARAMMTDVAKKLETKSNIHHRAKISMNTQSTKNKNQTNTKGNLHGSANRTMSQKTTSNINY